MLRKIISRIAKHPAGAVPEAFAQAEEALRQAGIVFTVVDEWTERDQRSSPAQLGPTPIPRRLIYRWAGDLSGIPPPATRLS